MKKTVFLLLTLAAIVTSCKYKDGPLISFRSPYERLTGYWQVEYFTINDNDFTQQYKDSCNYNFRITFYDTGHYLIDLYDGNYEYESCQGHPGQWGDVGFVQKNISISNILFIDLKGYLDSTGYELFKAGISSRWETFKLKNKKLWIQSIENNYDGSKTYYLKLKKL
jgi:hypothetical protein